MNFLSRHGIFSEGRFDIPLSRALFFLLIITATPLFNSFVLAEEIGFPEHYYGMLNYPLNQATQSGRFLELQTKTFGESNTFELLDRIPKTDKFRIAAEPIGRLAIKKVYRNGLKIVDSCTASVISKAYLITNYHCIPGTSPEATITDAQLELNFYSETMAQTDRVVIAVNPIPKDSDSVLDYSVLQLEDTVGDNFVLPTIRFREPIAGETLYMIHHPFGQAKRLSAYNCRVTTENAVDKSNLFHWCDSLPGSSGALLFSATDDSVVGIHYAEGVGKNIATMFSEVFKKSAIIQSISVRIFQPTQILKVVSPYSRLDTKTLTEAIYRKDIVLVKRHLQLGVTLNYSDPIYGDNALAAAVRSSSFEILEVLLANGAKPGPPEKAGNLLHIFVERSNAGERDLRILKRLLELGLPTTMNHRGLTAVCAAKNSVVIDMFQRYGVTCS
jgi:V8-like Glu-specific endopeptidase